MTLIKTAVLRMKNISKTYVMPAAKFEITRQCKVCGETFVAKTIGSWYCTP